ncbi:Down syndrome cell adhesion molecule [Exaiptasia diaphana]|nr:Down syndrome cell adhesion molecule [Exaiptasia diaphana]
MPMVLFSAFKDLSPANKYRMEVRGYTAVGSGPNNYYYFYTITSFQSWKISSSINNSTSINVNWEKYPGVGSVSSYIVICTANNRHRNISASSTNGRNLSLVVNNLLKYTEYKVVVLAMLGNSSFNLTNLDEKIFKSQEVVVKTAEDVPSKPPQNVTARYLGSNSVVVSWKPVDKEFTNGVIVGYYVYYQVAWTNVSYWEKEYISSDKTKAYLKNLKDVTLYRIEVSAATKIGEGPRSRGLFIKTGKASLLCLPFSLVNIYFILIYVVRVCEFVWPPRIDFLTRHPHVLCCAVLCCAVLCCAVLCCAVLCCAVLCCAVLCCAVLCCAQKF